MITFATFTLTEFYWADEFEFSPVKQQQERALNGATHIESALVTTGRPITLKSDLESASLFVQLQNHANTNQDPFNLTINGTVYSVIWLHAPLAVTGKPFESFVDAQPDNFTDISLTLITV